MSEVKRYTESCMEGGGVVESKDGELVDYSAYAATQSDLAALREELAEAYNRNAEQRVELDDLHDLKIYATIPLRERCVERKDLQQRLTAAEQRNATLETELRNIRQSCELSKLRDARIDALLVKPTESGASE